MSYYPRHKTRLPVYVLSHTLTPSPHTSSAHPIHTRLTPIPSSGSLASCCLGTLLRRLNLHRSTSPSRKKRNCVLLGADRSNPSIQPHNPAVTARLHFLCPTSKQYTTNPISPLFRLAPNPLPPLAVVHIFISLSFQPRTTCYQRHPLASNFAVQATSRPLIFGHLNEHFISPLNLGSGAYQRAMRDDQIV